jgi:hypothetical protein
MGKYHDFGHLAVEEICRWNFSLELDSTQNFPVYKFLQQLVVLSEMPKILVFFTHHHVECKKCKFLYDICTPFLGIGFILENRKTFFGLHAAKTISSRMKITYCGPNTVIISLIVLSYVLVL